MGLTKVTNDLLDLGSDTGALGLPKGTTAQRPSNPVEGTLRHNSEIDETKLETYNGTEWKGISQVSQAYQIDYLLLAGGAGGGGAKGGNATVFSSGGGAGGYKYGQDFNLTSGNTYNIIVGAGGTGGFGQAVSYAKNGENSLLYGSEINPIVAYGGIKPDLTGTLEKGGDSGYLPSNSGGSNYTAGAYWGGGGGAGIGANGGNGSSTSAGNGGNGLQFNITGSNVYYGGGGGGGIYQQSDSSGGLGGGGIGKGTNGDGGNGSPNTGGGGGSAGSRGGAGSTDYTGGTGGSGIVILRMPTANYSGTTTGSPTVTTDGTDTILTYTSSGTYTA